MADWISALQHSVFSTAIILALFFYGNKLVFILLRLLKLKEKQEFIAFVILVLIFSSLIHKWVADLLVKLGIISWIAIIILYYFLYKAFKEEARKS